MRRWFHGQLAGHYVGRPQVAGDRALPHGQQGFTIDIYRAVVRDVVLQADEPEPLPPAQAATEAAEGDADAVTDSLPPPPDEPHTPPVTHHHRPEGPALHQPHIAKVHFVDAHGPGRTVRAAALDVLASNVTFSHPASHNGKVYGRIEAMVSGWYSPPAEAPLPSREEPPPTPPGIVWDSQEVADVPLDPISRELSADAAPVPPAASLPDSFHDDATLAEAEAQAKLANETADSAQTPTTTQADLAAQDAGVAPEEPENDPPLLAIAMVIAALLGLLAAPQSALIWLLCFLPPFGLRKWLLGVVPDGPATAFMAYALGFGELLLAASTVAGYYSAGCRSLGPGALLGTIAAIMISSVLPRAFGFAASLLGLAAILFAYYARLGLPYCG